MRASTVHIGKGAKKGENSDSKGGAAGGSTAGSRRANVSELKGLVEVRARCQALRAGAGAVTAEGRPLLQVYGFLFEHFFGFLFPPECF